MRGTAGVDYVERVCPGVDVKRWGNVSAVGKSGIKARKGLPPAFAGAPADGC